MRRVPGSDDRRQSDFAADDGRVRRAPPVICDDRCRAPHDWHPVGIGGARDQNGAVDKPTNFLWTFDQADAPRHHGIANAQAREKATPFRFDAVGTQCTCFAAGLHGLRSCLHNEQLTRLAVFRPFHVHGPAIVLLDNAGPAGDWRMSLSSNTNRARSAVEVGTLRVGRSLPGA